MGEYQLFIYNKVYFIRIYDCFQINKMKIKWTNKEASCKDYMEVYYMKANFIGMQDNLN